MNATQARRLISEFEAGASLQALAADRGMSAPAAALALCRALKARADRFAMGGAGDVAPPAEAA